VRTIWKIIDFQTKLIKKALTKTRVTRVSTILLDIGALFLLYTPFSPEPPMIFAMSALALMYGAILAVIEFNEDAIDPE
jgi:hypothetical protein